MKAYIKPTVNVVVVEMQAMVCTSTTGLDGVSVSKNSFGGGGVDARRGGDWDDED